MKKKIEPEVPTVKGPQTDEEILHDLINNAENEQQVRYLTRKSDMVKDSKIEILQRDIALLQEKNKIGEARYNTVVDLFMKTFRGAHRYDDYND